MTSQNKDGDIQCEYVYDQDKSMPQQDASIFSGEYSDEDSDVDDKDIQLKPNASNNKIAKTSKKKRTSRYDENLYALPDNDHDDESEMRSLKSKLKSNETQLTTYKTQLATWKVASFVLIFALLISVGSISYLTVEKFGCQDKKKGTISLVDYRIYDVSKMEYINFTNWM